MPQDQGCDLMQRLADLHTAGHTGQAIAKAKHQLAEFGDDGRLWELLGTLAYADGDSHQALTALESASILVPLGTRGQLVLAKCYDEAGYRQAAGAIYRHVVTLTGLNDDDLFEPLASGLGRHGEYQLALAVCRTAARRMPENLEPLMGIVHYMRRLRIPPERILPTLFRAHHLAPEDKDCRITLAWLLHETGQSVEGAYLLEQLECEEFSCIRCLTLMQHIFESVGKTEQAGYCRNRLRVVGGDWPSGDDN